MGITQECCVQSWTSPGGNSPQDTNYTATCLPSGELSKLNEPDTQDTAGEAGTSSYVMYSYGPPHMAEQKQDDQHEQTFSSYMRYRDVALKTCQRRWTIRKNDERGLGISVLVARHDDDDEDDTSINTALTWIMFKKWLPSSVAGINTLYTTHNLKDILLGYFAIFPE